MILLVLIEKKMYNHYFRYLYRETTIICLWTTFNWRSGEKLITELLGFTNQISTNSVYLWAGILVPSLPTRYMSGSARACSLTASSKRVLKSGSTAMAWYWIAWSLDSEKITIWVKVNISEGLKVLNFVYRKRDVRQHFWRDIIYELGPWLAQAVRQNYSHNFFWLLGPIRELVHRFCPSRNVAWLFLPY